MTDVRAGKLFTIDKIETEDDISSQIDGITTVFTVATNYVPGTLKVYANGLRQQKGIGKDYNETAPNKFTFLVAPENDDILLAEYIKV